MQVVIAIVLLVVGALCGLFLLNIPAWYVSGEIPLIPALLIGETGLAGLILCCYGFYSFLLKDRLSERGAAALVRKHPDEPWLGNRQWAARKVSSSTIGLVGFLWFFAINWCAVLWFFANGRSEELLQLSWVELTLMAIFPIIGLITVWTAVKHTIRWWRYGSSTLLIETLPGRPGDAFKATIKTNFTTKPRQSYRLRLTGHERVWSRDNSDPAEIDRKRLDVRELEPFAEIEERVPPSKMLMADGTVTLPVSLQIPEDAPSSGSADPIREIIWQITVNSTGKSDPRFEARFQIPVFRKGSS